MSRRFYVSDDVCFLIQKYDHDFYEEIKDAIIKEKKYPTITVWNNLIVDGIEEFELCEANDIPYRINIINLPSKNHLYSWICSKQLLREDINSSMYRFLIGFQVLSEKAIEGNRIGLAAEDNTTVIKKMAKHYGYNVQRISWYKQFALNLIKVREISPKTAEFILSERLIASWNNVEYLSKRSSQDLEVLNMHITESDNSSLKFNDVQKAIDSEYRPKRAKKRINSENDLEIKRMPEYDPDSELRSLSLTITSWIDSMNRVNNKGFEETSKVAKKELSLSLKQLIENAYAMRRKLGTK